MFAPTTSSDAVDLNTLLDAFPIEFIEISPLEQGLAITLYRLLALAEPVTHQSLAQTSTIPVIEVDQLLEKWIGVYHDDTGNVIGFWGLALDNMPHKLLIDGRELYAWCAWDTLFLPALIGKIAQVTSRCTQSGAAIQLTLDSDRITIVNPGTTVLSFVTPDANGIRKDLISSFCHSVLFFASIELGELWTKEHPGTFLMSVENAFTLAQMINRRKFPKIMLS